MKKFSFLLMAGLIALAFGACSDDVDVSQENEKIADEVYMSFDLELPTSRSATDADGTTNSDANPDYEVGLDKENKVSKVKVVLATKDNDTYTYKAESKDDYVLAGDGERYTVTFEANELTDILPKENEEAPKVYAFVVCNPLTGFDAKSLFTGKGTVGDTDTDKMLEETIAKPNSFLMTNAEIAEVPSIPETLTSYNSPANPFDLGVVKVERTAARFDYKAVNGNIYPIMEEEGKAKVQVELTDVALVNMSKNYWWLRRVASPSNESGKERQYDPKTITLCGKETPSNYVVDTDAEEKLGKNDIAANFHYHVGTANINPTSFEYTSLSAITANDNWQGTDGYKIWRYATENTLPGIDAQLKKHSTGIVFKGVIKPANDEAEELLGGKENVYVFNNVLYGDWKKVAAAAKAKDNDGILVDAILNNAYLAVNATITGEQEPTKENATKAGFTVYSPNDGGEYEVYYYYWNRHNDNGDNNNMGVMEFAVVRNNVYKLSVTDINLFGHPGDPEGDPDPENPDDPDETDKVYFRVGVQVLPWVVRLNNIEF